MSQPPALLRRCRPTRALQRMREGDNETDMRSSTCRRGRQLSPRRKRLRTRRVAGVARRRGISVRCHRPTSFGPQRRVGVHPARCCTVLDRRISPSRVRRPAKNRYSPASITHASRPSRPVPVDDSLPAVARCSRLARPQRGVASQSVPRRGDEKRTRYWISAMASRSPCQS
jgi:hypothetical protein